MNLSSWNLSRVLKHLVNFDRINNKFYYLTGDYGVYVERTTKINNKWENKFKVTILNFDPLEENLDCWEWNFKPCTNIAPLKEDTAYTPLEVIEIIAKVRKLDFTVTDFHYFIS